MDNPAAAFHTEADQLTSPLVETDFEIGYHNIEKVFFEAPSDPDSGPSQSGIPSSSQTPVNCSSDVSHPVILKNIAELKEESSPYQSPLPFAASSPRIDAPAKRSILKSSSFPTPQTPPLAASSSLQNANNEIMFPSPNANAIPNPNPSPSPSPNSDPNPSLNQNLEQNQNLNHEDLKPDSVAEGPVQEETIDYNNITSLPDHNHTNAVVDTNLMSSMPPVPPYSTSPQNMSSVNSAEYVAPDSNSGSHRNNSDTTMIEQSVNMESGGKLPKPLLLPQDVEHQGKKMKKRRNCAIMCCITFCAIIAITFALIYFLIPR
jgi:hypothetical protein